MSKQKKDILQIKKYLAGKLDARSMHEMERRAQDDPFLQDALDGYENAGVKDESLEELTRRLNSRTAKKSAKIIYWRYAAIAASVLLFLTAGLLWFRDKEPATKQKIAARFAAPTIKKSTDTLPYTHEKTTEVAKLTKKASPKQYAPPRVAAPVTSQAVTSAPSASADLAVAEPVGNADVKEYKASPLPAIAKKDTALISKGVPSGYITALTGKVAGVNVKPTPANDQLNEVTITKGLSFNRAANYKMRNGIAGLVKDEGGEPIPGATVKIKGTGISAQTNANGYFKLDSVPNQPVLDVSFIGYERRQVAVNKRDSLVIAMQPNQQGLSEVVVTGYGVKKTLTARPQNGWAVFRKYLDDNAKSPDGKNGTVKLSFIINADNSLSDIKIIKGISAKTDSAAIELINAGPGWYANNNGKPEKIKVSIKFRGKE